jgi:hypothetical protein
MKIRKTLLDIHEPNLARRVNDSLEIETIYIGGKPYLPIEAGDRLKDVVYKEVKRIRAENVKPDPSLVYVDKWKKHTEDVVATLLTALETMEKLSEAVHQKTVNEFQAELHGIKI